MHTAVWFICGEKLKNLKGAKTISEFDENLWCALFREVIVGESVEFEFMQNYPLVIC